VLQQVVDYFKKRGSSVYITTLDDTKAFDRVNRKILIRQAY